MKTPKDLRLIYLIGTYPGLTTTFIDREISMLRRWGVKLDVLAIRQPAQWMPLSEQQKQLRQGVTYLLPVQRTQFLLSHLYFLLFRPLSYLGALFYLFFKPHPDFKSRLKTILHFGEGVYAAYILSTREFEELHAHFVDRTATLAFVIKRLLKKPYSLSIHAGADLYVKPILLPEKIGEARMVATCTRHNKKRIIEVVGDSAADKVCTLYHGLDLARYASAETGDGQAALPVPLILSVGQLTARKGFDLVVHACRLLKDAGRDFRYEIVGEGPQRAELEALIKDLGLESMVVLCGALSHERVIEKYRQAAFFALACRQTAEGDVDGFPNVIGEAMAMRLAVVSTAISAIPELLVDGHSGLLVPPEQVEPLAFAMERLLADSTLRQTLAQNGWEKIRNDFDVQRNVRQFAEALWPAWFKEAGIPESDAKVPVV